MTEEQEMRVVAHGMQLMRVLAEIHGHEKGMELWNTIGETLGAEIKGKIFFAMLTGKGSGTSIMIKEVYSDTQKIPLIKAIRSVDSRSLGLAEAKKLSEDLMDRKMPVTLVIDSESYFASKRELINAGCVIA
jgi:ribosomal protein L7/L12